MSDPPAQPQRRHEQRGRHDGHVLQQEHAQRVAAMYGIDLLAPGQHPHRGGGTAHGDDGPDSQRGGTLGAEEAAQHRRGGTGEQDLQRAPPDRNGADTAQPSPGKLQADGEQEEGDPQLGNGGHRLVTGQHVQGVGTEQRAGEQVAEQGALLEPLAQRSQEHGDSQEDQHIEQRGPEVHHSVFRQPLRGGVSGGGSRRSQRARIPRLEAGTCRSTDRPSSRPTLRRQGDAKRGPLDRIPVREAAAVDSSTATEAGRCRLSASTRSS